MTQIGPRTIVESVARTAPSAPRSAVEETFIRHGAALFALAVVLLEDLKDAESLVTQALLDSCTPQDLTSPLINRHDLARYVYVLWLRKRGPSAAPVLPSRRIRSRRAPGLKVARGLSHLQRTSIALALFGDHTYVEIASLMDLPAAEVADLMRSGLTMVAATRD